ncbi:hypothetical protein MRA01_20560 [Methylobacterium radiotolerans]|nr:hypothetical protein MRA01_20560 [Methylobacterium radiotolerans]
MVAFGGGVSPGDGAGFMGRPGPCQAHPPRIRTGTVREPHAQAYQPPDSGPARFRRVVSRPRKPISDMTDRKADSALCATRQAIVTDRRLD